MKKLILIGIDFTETSTNAMHYGISLANKMEADIRLVWVDTKTPTDDDIETKIQHEARYESKQSLKSLCEDISKKHPHIGTSHKVRKGMVHRELAYAAKESKATLMLIGTDGVDGIEEFRIDNNTFRIIAQSPCPVISIRKGFVATHRFDKLMLPIDEMQNTLDKLALSIDLAQSLKAKIDLLNIYHPNIEALKHQTNMHSTKANKILNEYEIMANDSLCLHSTDPKAIVQQAIDANVDLLVIMTNPVMSRADIPEGILAQHIIHACPIPILSVQAKPLT